MKKKLRKLTISRETLCSLERMPGVRGGIGPSAGPACQITVFGTKCIGTTGSYGDCGPSAACSNGCATGGTACTAIDCVVR